MVIPKKIERTGNLKITRGEGTKANVWHIVTVGREHSDVSLGKGNGDGKVEGHR